MAPLEFRAHEGVQSRADLGNIRPQAQSGTGGKPRHHAAAGLRREIPRITTMTAAARPRIAPISPPRKIFRGLFGRTGRKPGSARSMISTRTGVKSAGRYV